MNRVDLQEMAQSELDRQQAFRCRLLCCASTPCLSSGSTAVSEALKTTLEKRGLDAEVEIVSTGCMGPCSRGPLVTVRAEGKDDVVYENVTPDIAEKIVDEHVVKNAPVESNILPNDIPFFAKQRKVVLSNSGLIDPGRLEDYVARGGYAALGHALREMSQEEVCATITNSGLRGRGGAGYPTGIKWDLVRKSPSDRKFVVANGDEGDPGAYMDRTLMESDPHRVLEGLAIAGYATGAEQGYIYVRGEYPIAAQRLQRAIRARGTARPSGQSHDGEPHQFPNRRAYRGRSLCVRGRNRAHGVHHGQTRAAGASAALSRRERSVGKADADQQCRDFWQHCADSHERARLVFRYRDREEQRNQDLRIGGQRGKHRPDRGPHGYHSA